MFVLDCANPCRFLGGYENEPRQVNTEKTEINSSGINQDKTEVNENQNASVTFCSLCNVEMSQTKTRFKINGWEGSNQKPTGDDSVKFGEDVLPVIIYLCPKCGKINLRVDEKTNKNWLD
jgi:hypothetical protein